MSTRSVNRIAALQYGKIRRSKHVPACAVGAWYHHVDNNTIHILCAHNWFTFFVFFAFAASTHIKIPINNKLHSFWTRNSVNSKLVVMGITCVVHRSENVHMFAGSSIFSFTTHTPGLLWCCFLRRIQSWRISTYTQCVLIQIDIVATKYSKNSRFAGKPSDRTKLKEYFLKAISTPIGFVIETMSLITKSLERVNNDRWIYYWNAPFAGTLGCWICTFASSLYELQQCVLCLCRMYGFKFESASIWCAFSCTCYVSPVCTIKCTHHGTQHLKVNASCLRIGKIYQVWRKSRYSTQSMRIKYLSTK